MVKVFSLTITLLITLFFLLILPNQISAATITCGGNDYDSATACPQGYQFQCNNNTPTCVNTTTCSTPTLSVEIPGSGIKINNEDPAITDSIYVSASGSCSSSANTQYFFRLRYYDDAAQRWYTQSETEWQTSNNTGFSLDSGIREYFVEAFMPNGNSTTEAGSYFYKMEKTSSADSTSITSTSALLNWSLRMNYYTDLVPPAFYILFGKDPAISTNRQPTAGEIYRGQGQLQTSSLDLTNYRATYLGDSYSATSNLTPDTTYYWRIRSSHPSAGDSYFAGGSFKTLPAAPAPTVTTNQSTNVDKYSATLNGTVIPHDIRENHGFYYNSVNPGTCSNIPGWGQVPNTSAQNIQSGSTETALSFSQTITGLTSDTTYYFCAIAANSSNVAYGRVEQFKTPAVKSRTDDGTKEADWYIDYYDDWGSKNLELPAGSFNNNDKVKLWVYGQGYGDKLTGNTAALTVDNNTSYKIEFNPIDKFGTTFNWKSFDIPLSWLNPIGNSTTHTFKFTDPLPSSHWTANNLDIGVDTNSTGNSTGCTYDGSMHTCFQGTNVNVGTPRTDINGELMVYLQRVQAPTVSCSPDPQTTAINQPVTWSAAISGGLSPFTYSWELSPAFTCVTPATNCTANASPTVSYSNAGTKTANLIVTDSNNITADRVFCSSLTIPEAASGGPPTPQTVTTCGAEGLELLEGLLTTPGQPVSQSTTETTKCIIDPKAAFAPFKIPSFDDLKSLYYTQKK